MLEYVPVALRCGHLVDGPAWYDVDPKRIPVRLVDCPKGCGFVEYVCEPIEQEEDGA